MQFPCHSPRPTSCARVVSTILPMNPSSAPNDGDAAPRGLARLWQPRRGLFWLTVASNLLAAFWGWLLRSDQLSPVGLAVVGVLALSNTLLGMWLLWRLLRGG